MARLSKEPLFASNNEAAMNMFSSRCAPCPMKLHPSAETFTYRAETMLSFLTFLREKYGGAEAYLKSHCGFTEDDIVTIRERLLVSKDDSAQ